MKRYVRFALCAALLICTRALSAQNKAPDRTAVFITVVSDAGDSLAFARVEITGEGIDAVVRTNVRGRATVLMPAGRVHFRVVYVGYAPADGETVVGSDDIRVEFRLNHLTQLAAIDVVANWIGVRGVVGDVTLAKTIPGATVSALRGPRKTQSDSVGRFELAIDDAIPTVVNVERAGYLPKTTLANLSPGHAPELTVLLTPGRVSRIMNARLVDLRARTAFISPRAALIGREQLGATNQNLEVALQNSSIMHDKNLRFQGYACIFANGEPQYGVPLVAYTVADIEFVEVYGTAEDHTGLMQARWPHGYKCGSIDNPQPGMVGYHNVQYVGVWLRR